MSTNNMFSSFRIEAMKDANLELQFVMPEVTLKTAAHLHRDEELMLELKTDLKLPHASSEQAIAFKYGESNFLPILLSDEKRQMNICDTL